MPALGPRALAKPLPLVAICAWTSRARAPCCRAASRRRPRRDCDAAHRALRPLVVTETFPDASPEVVRREQEREKTEARSTDSLKNCSSEVSRAEMDCAMRATSTTAFEKCLE